jgi:tellurite resistance protein
VDGGNWYVGQFIDRHLECVKVEKMSVEKMSVEKMSVEKMSKKNFIAAFPVSMFAIVMGMSGLVMALREAEKHGLVFPGTDYVAWLVFGVFAVIALLYSAKALVHGGEVKNEYNNNMIAGFFSTISISMVLVGSVLEPMLPGVAQAIWKLGALGQLFFTVVLVNRWIYDTRVDLAMLTPVWFIPAVGNIIVPVTGFEYASVAFNMFFLSIGLLFWFVLFVLLMFRLFFDQPLTESAAPTMFIMLAPPAAGFIGLVNFYPDEINFFVYFLYFSALFLFVLLFAKIFGFIRIQFSLSWWAYSFPLAILTVATFKMYELVGVSFLNVFAWFLLVTLVMLIAYLLARTVLVMFRRQLF